MFLAQRNGVEYSKAMSRYDSNKEIRRAKFDILEEKAAVG